MGALFVKVGGVWTEVAGGGGADEVWIGPDAPADPAVELWFDTDAVAFDVNKLPRGVVGFANGATADSAGIGSTATDIAGMSVSFTAEATRIYKTTVTVCIQNGATVGVPGVIIRNGANGVIRQGSISAVVSQLSTVTMAVTESGLSGAQVRKASLSTNAGTVIYVGGFSRHGSIVVEDVGGT